MTTDKTQVLAMWRGKAVGGTLGAPWEGSHGPHDLTFYRPVPDGMVPNDDLDLQVLWAAHLAGDWGGEVSRGHFAAAWLADVRFPWDEYGLARRNLALGIPPPWSGAYDNAFAGGLGAAIRSELWAALAPGDPARAAAFAREDGCVDHAGCGVDAEAYWAALESLAFAGGAPADLAARALAFLPADSALHAPVRDALRLCAAPGATPHGVRAALLAAHGSPNFTDARMNLALAVAALALGGGDFGRTVCLAVDFGQDTDCTGATVGAVLGILDPAGIPARWLAPIGDAVVLNPGVRCPDAPATLDALADLVLALRPRVRLAPPPSKAWRKPTSSSASATATTSGCSIPSAPPREGSPRVPASGGALARVRPE